MKEKIFIYFLLAAGTLLIFWKTGNFEFINYDDPNYVYTNSHVTTGLTWVNIRWALTASEMGNWNPLTWLSHMLDCELYGLSPRGHHLTNAILHVTNTVLLCFALNLATGSFLASVCTAALFGVHPLHVESVAWVSERKDLLSATFFIITVIAYTCYVRKPALKRYLLVVVSFILGLSAKPMLITLPLVLLLLDYWPLNRFKHSKSVAGSFASRQLSTILLEKIPLLFISIAVSTITFSIQKDHGNLLQLDQHTVADRLANVVMSYTTYIIKSFWPDNLAIFYPIEHNLPTVEIAGSILILLCITAFVIVSAKHHPFLLTGWLWFIIMLVPVIGFVQAGLQSRADRYTYLPLIGIFIMIVWGVSRLLEIWQWHYKNYLVALSAITILSSLAFVTSRQLDYWKDGITLYTHTLGVTCNNFTVHYNLAVALADKQRMDEAIFHYKEAIRTAPLFFEEAYTSLGEELEQLGKFKEAIYYYSEILRHNPENLIIRERMKRTMNRIINIK